MSSARTSITMPEQMQVQLEELSESENRSVSAMIQVLIKEGFERRGIVDQKSKFSKKKILLGGAKVNG